MHCALENDTILDPKAGRDTRLLISDITGIALLTIIDEANGQPEQNVSPKNYFSYFPPREQMGDP